MKKHIANCITGIRILMAPVLLVFRKVNGAYLILLSICGFTDLIDGPVARKTGSVSTLGSVLDTVGDVLLYLSAIRILVITEHRSGPLLWMIGMMGIHLLASIIGSIRFKTFFFVHNVSAKAWGMLMFLLPFAIWFGWQDAWMIVICAAATFSAIDALLIQIFSIEPMPDARSAFALLKKDYGSS